MIRHIKLSFMFMSLFLIASIPAFAETVQEEWVKFRPGHFYAGFDALDLDADGNVYVVGYDDLDYVTIKYSPDGDLIWEERFAHGVDTWDRASAIEVDQAGAVVVSGHSYDFDRQFGSYVTVKYDTNGEELWVAVFDDLDSEISGQSADYLTLDSQGNVYVTGLVRNGESFDYVTVKYDAAGHHQWTSLFGGEPLGDDAPSDIVTDEAGNVYVTGTSEGHDGLFDYATVMYDPDGNELWRNRYDNNLELWYQRSRLDACPEGGVVIVGGDQWGPQYDDCDFITIRYLPDGGIAWSNTYSWPQAEWYEYDYANAVVVDAEGNAIVTGPSMDIDTYYDFATVKYSPAGKVLWTARYSGVAGYDWPTAIALDDLGDVYVTGMMELWFSTVKYGADGDARWSIVWEGPSVRYDASVHGIRVDSSRNVYIHGQNNYTGLTTIKYTQDPTTEIPFIASARPTADGPWLRNHPNPLNPATTIEFDLSRQEAISLRIFDVQGRLVTSLADGLHTAGNHDVIWRGVDGRGRRVAPGVYFVRLEAGEITDTERLVVSD